MTIEELLRKAQRGDLKVAVCRHEGGQVVLEGVLALDPQGQLVLLPGGWPDREENLRELRDLTTERRTGTSDRVFLAALPMRLHGFGQWAFPVGDAEAEALLAASRSGPLPKQAVPAG